MVSLTGQGWPDQVSPTWSLAHLGRTGQIFRWVPGCVRMEIIIWFMGILGGILWDKHRWILCLPREPCPEHPKSWESPEKKSPAEWSWKWYGNEWFGLPQHYKYVRKRKHPVLIALFSQTLNTHPLEILHHNNPRGVPWALLPSKLSPTLQLVFAKDELLQTTNARNRSQVLAVKSDCQLSNLSNCLRSTGGMIRLKWCG